MAITNKTLMIAATSLRVLELIEHDNRGASAPLFLFANPARLWCLPSVCGVQAME